MYQVGRNNQKVWERVTLTTMNKEVTILERRMGQRNNTEQRVPQQISHSQNWQSSPREPAKLKVRGKSCISSKVFGRLSEGCCGQVSPAEENKANQRLPHFVRKYERHYNYIEH